MTPRLPTWARAMYGLGSLASNALGITRDTWLLFFYIEGGAPRGPAFAVGIALFLVRLIEAFNDPLFGHFSDRTRTRLGRRIPYVLLGTPFMAIAFIFLWTPPDVGSSMGNVLYLFFAIGVFHLFMTLSGGPFEAMFPEIARSREDRLSISSWQVIFGMTGTTLALVATGPVIDRYGFVVMAVLMAAVSGVTRLLALSGGWQRSIEAARTVNEDSQEPSLLRSLTGSLRNEQFVRFVLSHVCYSVGVGLVIAALPFDVKTILGQEKPGSMVAVIMGVAILVLLIALPFIIRAAHRYSKRAVYSAGMLFSGLYFPLIYWAGFVPGVSPVVQVIAVAALIGLPFAPVQTFPTALIADICDYDTLQTGKRREATFYAMHATVNKTAGGLPSLLLPLLLMLGDTAANPLGLRLVGPVAGLLTLAGYFVFRGYWLPDEVTEENVAAAQAAHAPAPIPAVP